MDVATIACPAIIWTGKIQWGRVEISLDGW